MITSERPDLSEDMQPETFGDFYYLKSELVDFCRIVGLSTQGSKSELNHRVSHFLETGEKLQPIKRPSSKYDTGLDMDGEIEPNIRCSEVHRRFFKEHIGNGFKFNVDFMHWLRSNSGKTYREAVSEYWSILDRKKHSKTKIDKQFEYNTYVREFFSDNKKASLDDAIQCWKYKKGLPGHNRYERSDKAALEK